MSVYETIKPIFPQILKDNKGFIYKSCDIVGITPTTYYAWRTQDPDFAIACDYALNKVYDRAEELLWERMEDQETAAIIFYCKTKLRHRGYSDEAKVLNQINYSLQNITNNTISDKERCMLERYVEDRLKYLSSDHSEHLGELPNASNDMVVDSTASPVIATDTP